MNVNRLRKQGQFKHKLKLKLIFKKTPYCAVCAFVCVFDGFVFVCGFWFFLYIVGVTGITCIDLHVAALIGDLLGH